LFSKTKTVFSYIPFTRSSWLDKLARRAAEAVQSPRLYATRGFVGQAMMTKFV